MNLRHPKIGGVGLFDDCRHDFECRLALKRPSLTFGSFALLITSLFCASCKEEDGGPCRYNDTAGTATIVAIRQPPQNVYSCPNDPVEVDFNFVPSDVSRADLQADNVRVTVGSGANPNRAYILAKGFGEGNVMPCIREDIGHGACTPIIYTFPGVDLSDYADSCFSESDN